MVIGLESIRPWNSGSLPSPTGRRGWYEWIKERPQEGKSIFKTIIFK